MVRTMPQTAEISWNRLASIASCAEVPLRDEKTWAREWWARECPGAPEARTAEDRPGVRRAAGRRHPPSGRPPVPLNHGGAGPWVPAAGRVLARDHDRAATSDAVRHGQPLPDAPSGNHREHRGHRARPQVVDGANSRNCRSASRQRVSFRLCGFRGLCGEYPPAAERFGPQRAAGLGSGEQDGRVSDQIRQPRGDQQQPLDRD